MEKSSSYLVQRIVGAQVTSSCPHRAWSAREALQLAKLGVWALERFTLSAERLTASVPAPQHHTLRKQVQSCCPPVPPEDSQPAMPSNSRLVALWEATAALSLWRRVMRRECSVKAAPFGSKQAAD